MSESLILATAEATESAGTQLAAQLLVTKPPLTSIFLRGDLGAGKTTFSRGFLRGLGHGGRVPSPTYTLVEPYQLAGYRVAHLDLYRLQSGAELEFLGIDELTDPPAIVLIEWPERATGFLPPMDLEVILKVNSHGRELTVRAGSPVGEQLREAWRAALQ